MEIKEFDKLLKRVNFEDENGIKSEMLSIIGKYLDVMNIKDVTIEELTEKAMPVVVEVPREEKAEPVVDVILEEVKTPETPVEENTEEAPVVEEAVVETVEEEPAVENKAVEKKLTSKEMQAIIDAQETEEVPAIDTREEDMDSENAQAAFDLGDAETVADDKQESAEPEVKVMPSYVENFGLLSTTKSGHLTLLKTNGAVLFRDKRSYMLWLALENEVIGIAKTPKIDEFPDFISSKLKNGEFYTADILSIGKEETKGRTRYVDIEFSNYKMLKADHPTVVSIKEMLEDGKTPETEKEEKAEETAEKPSETVMSFMVNPNLVSNLKDSKEQILTQEYAISTQGGQSKLLAKSANGPVMVGLKQDSPLADRNILVNIKDYVLAEADGHTYANFTFVPVGETVEQAKVEPKPAEETAEVKMKPVADAKPLESPEPVVEKPIEASTGKAPNVTMTNIHSVPADFPRFNRITLKLHPYAAEIFSEEKAKELIGKPVNLAFYNRPSDDMPMIAMITDVFEMATTANVLTSERMSNSKWVARLTKYEFINDEKGKFVVVEYDYLVEYPQFPEENPETAIDVLKYVPITEESFTLRVAGEVNPDVLANANPKKAEPVKYNPEAATSMITPTQDYTEAKSQLIDSSVKDIGGQMEQIRNANDMTAHATNDVLGQAQKTVSDAIEQTALDTGIKVMAEAKSTTEIMGGLNEEVGAMSETEASIVFFTPYPAGSWTASVDRELDVKSFIDFNETPSAKTVQIVGNQGQVIAQGTVDLNVAMLMDGTHHKVKLLSVENAEQVAENRYNVTLRIGNVVKVA